MLYFIECVGPCIDSLHHNSLYCVMTIKMLTDIESCEVFSYITTVMSLSSQ